MDFTQRLKEFAELIYKEIDRRMAVVRTWDQLPSAPVGGHKDRVGFLIDDGVELYADAWLVQETQESLLRARIARIEENNSQEIFTIVTLDFNADRASIAELIDHKELLTVKKLVEILQEVTTKPKLIHVSLETSTDDNGNMTGTRHEYSQEDIDAMSAEQQDEFIMTVENALNKIGLIAS